MGAGGARGGVQGPRVHTAFDRVHRDPRRSPAPDGPAVPTLHFAALAKFSSRFRTFLSDVPDASSRGEARDGEREQEAAKSLAGEEEVASEEDQQQGDVADRRDVLPMGDAKDTLREVDTKDGRP